MPRCRRTKSCICRRTPTSITGGDPGDGRRPAGGNPQRRDDHRSLYASQTSIDMATVEAGMHPAVAQSLLIGKPLRIRRFLLASLIAHFALFGAIATASYLHFGPAIDLNQQPIKASLIRLGKPRDPKLLPRIEEPPPEVEQKTAAPEPPKPAEPPPPAAPDTKAVSISPGPKRPPEKSNADRRKEL